MKEIGEKSQIAIKPNEKVVKIYEQKEELADFGEKVFKYDNEEVHKGLEKYRDLHQGKITDINVASLGAMLEVLKISEDNQIKRIDKVKL